MNNSRPLSKSTDGKILLMSVNVLGGRYYQVWNNRDLDSSRTVLFSEATSKLDSLKLAMKVFKDYA